MDENGRWYVQVFNAEYPYAVCSPSGQMVAWCARLEDAEQIVNALNDLGEIARAQGIRTEDD